MKSRQLTVAVLGVLVSSAAFAAGQAKLPPEQHQGHVAFLTGGIGQAEAKAFERAAPRFPVALEFADRVGKRDEFISGVNVKVSDQHGKTVLSTMSDGPFLLAKVPSGRYTVTATYKGKTLKRTVNAHAQAGHPLVMEWKDVA